MSGAPRAGARKVLGVGLAARTEIQDALSDDADHVSCSTAKLSDLSTEALVRVARDQQLGFFNRALDHVGVEGAS